MLRTCDVECLLLTRGVVEVLPGTQLAGPQEVAELAVPVVLGDHESLLPARMREVIELLLTVGYIDGILHEKERKFVEQYIESGLRFFEKASGPEVESRALGRRRWRHQFDDLYARITAEIAGVVADVSPRDASSYLTTRLKVRAIRIFASLSEPERTTAISMVRSLIQADGTISDEEQSLHDELMTYLAAVPAAPMGGATEPSRAREMTVRPSRWLPLTTTSHPLLDPLEHTYSPHPTELQSQLGHDYQLVARAIATWNMMRARGHGGLAGIGDIEQLARGTRFLDGHVHVLRPQHPTELVVLGDLHGCYGCLKAALLQSDFIRRAWAHQWDPANHPDVKLVLLGDYIDRGRFSFDGVLRAVLNLFVSLPDHVIVLRGNHESFLHANGRIFSAVHPAEALASFAPHVPFELLEAYRVLFESMPTSFLVERTLFVHGGVPRDDTFAARYRDLSSLNEPELRFQMLWSDPEQTEHVPVALQRMNPRFSFGRQQFRAFMERTGCRTMVRGHEKIDAGFETTYSLGNLLLLNLFSSGGSDNRDLPVGAPYRSVTPMALTVQYGHGSPPVATPWPIHYQPFNYESHNNFHRAQPLLPFRVE